MHSSNSGSAENANDDAVVYPSGSSTVLHRSFTPVLVSFIRFNGHPLAVDDDFGDDAGCEEKLVEGEGWKSLGDQGSLDGKGNSGENVLKWSLASSSMTV